MNHDDKQARETRKFLDNLTEFVTSDYQSVEDLVESLRIEGVDAEESLQLFRKILSQYDPTWREKASRARSVFVESYVSQAIRMRRTRVELQEAIENILESIQRLGAPVEVGAYHRKFEEATDVDLESLVDDLQLQLDLLVKGSK